MNRLTEHQVQSNAAGRESWNAFRAHRAKVTELLCGGAGAGSRLCVLGAGNCNDLDLAWLIRVFREVHLVDIDIEAPARALKRQGVAESAPIHLHAPFDLTAITARVDQWSGRAPEPGEIDAALGEIASSPPPELPAKFEVVLSPCVLSQTFNPARDAMGATHPRFPKVLAALRARHLRMMLDLLTPGGKAILVNDVTSSDRFPPLARVPTGELPDLMRKLVSEQKCYRGLEPAAMIAALRSDPRAAKWELAAPWLWHVGLERTYLVYALCIIARMF